MSEELRLEDTVEQRIGFLGADHEREPVIPQIGGAGGLDSPDWNRPFRRDRKLIIDDALCDNKDMSIRLIC